MALWRFSSPLWTWWCAEENSVRKPGAYLLLAYSRSQRLRMLTAVMRRSSMRGSSQRRSFGPLLLLVVVEVRIAGMPALERELVPALHPDVGGHHAARRDVQVQRSGGIFGAALGHDPRGAPGRFNLEGAVGVEERRARADLQDSVRRMYGLAGGDEDLYTRRDRLAGRGVYDGPGYLWHLSTCICVFV